MTITRTLAAALAAMALTAPTALARPADMHVPAVQTATQDQPKQDLRSADAKDAAQNASGTRDAALPLADRQPVTPAPVAETPDSGGIGWMTIGIGIAGSLLAVSGLAVLAGRSRRIPRPRISA
jgi:hypothetical protein